MEDRVHIPIHVKPNLSKPILLKMNRLFPALLVASAFIISQSSADCDGPVSMLQDKFEEIRECGGCTDDFVSKIVHKYSATLL